MIGDTVSHPQYGCGTITALYRNGEEWMVRFESGLRFRRPRTEFDREQPLLTTPTTSSVLPNIIPAGESQRQARQLVESLRLGIAPAHHIENLTVGFDRERKHLTEGLNQAHRDGGAVSAVVGDYGFGKSHLVELAAQAALRSNFLVATTSLDLQELPAHRSFDIYAQLMRNLRYPDTDETGLGPLLAAATARADVRSKLATLTSEDVDPLTYGLAALANTSSSRQRRAWNGWLMGGRRVNSMNRAAPRKVKFRSIYRIGHNARQVAYLLSGISVLSRLIGYSGLCLLIDEAESYSLLKAYQRPKADLFFGAVIYAALQDRQDRLAPEDFPQHRYRDYPMAYTERQSLYLLFTMTQGDTLLPVDTWLDDGQILTLSGYHTAQETGSFLEKVMVYHSRAYSYEIGDRQRQVRRGAAEHMALGMLNNAINFRSVVRLGVEMFDLLYLYPTYKAATILNELRAIVR